MNSLGCFYLGSPCHKGLESWILSKTVLEPLVLSCTTCTIWMAFACVCVGGVIIVVCFPYRVGRLFTGCARKVGFYCCFSVKLLIIYRLKVCHGKRQMTDSTYTHPLSFSDVGFPCFCGGPAVESWNISKGCSSVSRWRTLPSSSNSTDL